jgi:hypothetical protein
MDNITLLQTIILSVSYYVIISISLMRIFAKYGKSRLLAWIPIANSLIYYQIAQKPKILNIFILLIPAYIILCLLMYIKGYFDFYMLLFSIIALIAYFCLSLPFYVYGVIPSFPILFIDFFLKPDSIKPLSFFQALPPTSHGIIIIVYLAILTILLFSIVYTINYRVALENGKGKVFTFFLTLFPIVLLPAMRSKTKKDQNAASDGIE